MLCVAHDQGFVMWRHLLEAKAAPDHPNANGATALICGACNGHVEAVEALIEQVRLTESDSFIRGIDMMLCGRMLIWTWWGEQGADVNAQTAHGGSALIGKAHPPYRTSTASCGRGFSERAHGHRAGDSGKQRRR